MKNSTVAVGPDFLCIGAPKCGSTWLYDLLGSHPEIFFPAEVKELRFFSRYYNRGVDWYRNLYKGCEEFQVAGDVTPHYLYVDSVERMAEFNLSFKLILIHRDPTKRCVSHYKFRRRSDNYEKSFEEFQKDYPEAIEWGFYAKHLLKFVDVFPAEQFLVLKFEDATDNVEQTKLKLAKFLEVDYSLFPTTAGYEKVNVHGDPKFPLIYKLGSRVSRILVDTRLYRLRNILKSFASALLASRGKPKVSKARFEISSDQIEKLNEVYREDQIKLDQIVSSFSRIVEDNPSKFDSDVKN